MVSVAGEAGGENRCCGRRWWGGHASRPVPVSHTSPAGHDHLWQPRPGSDPATPKACLSPTPNSWDKHLLGSPGWGVLLGLQEVHPSDPAPCHVGGRNPQMCDPCRSSRSLLQGLLQALLWPDKEERKVSRWLLTSCVTSAKFPNRSGLNVSSLEWDY